MNSHLDSAREDIPVMVDTTYADTAKDITDPMKRVIDTGYVQKNTEIEHNEPAYLRVQQVYTSFIGVREATDNNDGKEVEMFLKNVGLGKGYAWCAAFVKYCFLQAGVKSAEKINGMAMSCENKNDYIYNRGKKIKNVQTGDVFTLWYASLKRIGHTGFVDKQINSRFYESVEGNTNVAGSREGDGVYRKRRSYNATYSITRW